MRRTAQVSQCASNIYQFYQKQRVADAMSGAGASDAASVFEARTQRPAAGSDILDRGAPKGEPAPDAPTGLRPEYQDAMVPEIPDRGGYPGGLLPKDVEPHAIVAVLVLIVAVCVDAITALDPTNNAEEAASSLRTSSLVTLLAVSAPGIGDERRTESQRLVIGALLAFLALSGRHSGALGTRIGDLVYCAVVLCAGARIYSQGGIEAEDVRPDDPADSPHRRQSIGALFGGLLLYVGLRGVRAAFVSSSEAADFRAHYAMYDATLSSPGYAFSSLSVVAPLGGGYGVLAATGATVLLHSDARLVGSSAVAFEVAAAGVTAAVAALWALLGYSEQLDTLVVVFGPHACSSSRGDCEAAYHARRFAMVNNSTAGLWLGALACCVFSFAIERRIFCFRPTRAEHVCKREGIVFSTVMAAAAVAALLVYGSTDGSQWHTDTCARLAILGIYLSFNANTIAGTALYAGAQLYEECVLLQNYGQEDVFKHLTHCTLFVLVALLGLHALCSIAKAGMIACCGKYWKVTDVAIASTATIGTSLAAGLYLASALLLACSNGSLPEDKDLIREGSGRRTMIAFGLNHFIVLFAWLPLYACRCEVQNMNARARVATWLVAVPAMAAFYYAVLGLMQTSAPALSIVETWPFCIVGAVTAASWAAGAFV